jgi:hypothetical protein
MGTVYEAEQLEPLRRMVALKVIRRGMDTEEVLARFESERQALAVMDHPNIARALEAGTTDEGLPYFVMELVAGEPITAYCDRHGLGVRQRLQLFLGVCRGVQHAHQKGVIHRDLKPSNILVRVTDGQPIPTIIDFGIAEAIEHRGYRLDRGQGDRAGPQPALRDRQRARPRPRAAPGEQAGLRAPADARLYHGQVRSPPPARRVGAGDGRRGARRGRHQHHAGAGPGRAGGGQGAGDQHLPGGPVQIRRPVAGGGRQTTVVDALAEGVKQVNAGRIANPVIASSVRRTIGTVYQGLGRNAEADSLYRQTLRERLARTGPASEETAQSWDDLGTMLTSEGKLDSAETALGRALAIR